MSNELYARSLHILSTELAKRIKDHYAALAEEAAKLDNDRIAIAKLIGLEMEREKDEVILDGFVTFVRTYLNIKEE